MSPRRSATRLRARRLFGRRGGLAVVLVGIVLAGSAPARGESAKRVLTLEPDQTNVQFTLGATLHDVEGRLPLVRGELRFPPGGGAASGQIVLDARGATTGLGLRDDRMHEEVLESQRFPKIAFDPDRLEVTRREDDRRADVVLSGTLHMHGQGHPVRIPATVERTGSGELQVRAAFDVRYVDWGMKNVSGFLLRVADHVHVTIDARGRLSSPSSVQAGED